MKQEKEKYQFWETQPVVQFNQDRAQVEDGPIDEIKQVSDVKQQPYTLPDNFEWCTCDMSDPDSIKEVYELLSNNYVEDDDNMFRFAYSPAFLQWALQPPGYKQEWHLGVRVRSTRKLVGFITAIPASVRARQSSLDLVEINFLCVHKKLRAKRLAPVLIKEITRRVNLHNIWQAVYTAGVVIPRPLAQCRYWHRSLNPKKLIDVGFSRLAPRMTLARTLKLFKLAATPATPGLRELQPGDIGAVTRLLNEHLAQYKLAQIFTEEELQHWLRPCPDVLEAFVVEDPSTGEITDLISFYCLPSSILGHPEHTLLKAAYMFYTVAAATPLKQLMSDALVLALARGYDVFNALDVLHNKDFLVDLKFGIGDGQLHYYLYNWRVAEELQPSDVGLILL